MEILFAFPIYNLDVSKQMKKFSGLFLRLNLNLIKQWYLDSSTNDIMDSRAIISMWHAN